MTHYELLAVDPRADAVQIWHAYLAARASLPASGWPRWRAWLQGRTEVSLAQAFQDLRDPIRRAAYDRWLAARLDCLCAMPPAH